MFKICLCSLFRFLVGAVHLENGEIITGNNQENVAYPSALCAERVVIFMLNHNFQILKLIVYSCYNFKKFEIEDVVSPCGGM